MGVGVVVVTGGVAVVVVVMPLVVVLVTVVVGEQISGRESDVFCRSTSLHWRQHLTCSMSALCFCILGIRRFLARLSVQARYPISYPQLHIACKLPFSPLSKSPRHNLAQCYAPVLQNQALKQFIEVLFQLKSPIPSQPLKNQSINQPTNHTKPSCSGISRTMVKVIQEVAVYPLLGKVIPEVIVYPLLSKVIPEVQV